MQSCDISLSVKTIYKIYKRFIIFENISGKKKNKKNHKL